jgi:hypothetical protein
MPLGPTRRYLHDMLPCETFLTRGEHDARLLLDRRRRLVDGDSGPDQGKPGQGQPGIHRHERDHGYEPSAAVAMAMGSGTLYMITDHTGTKWTEGPLPKKLAVETFEVIFCHPTH